MVTTKERKSNLIKWANECILKSSIYKGGMICNESYNGQIAAFSVSVALSGLKPAMALYYSDKGSSDVDKKEIVKLLAGMYSKDKKTAVDDKSFYLQVINSNGKEENDYQRMIIEYAIALKLTIRTFKFKKNEQKSS